MIGAENTLYLLGIIMSPLHSIATSSLVIDLSPSRRRVSLRTLAGNLPLINNEFILHRFPHELTRVNPILVILSAIPALNPFQLAVNP